MLLQAVNFTGYRLIRRTLCPLPNHWGGDKVKEKLKSIIPPQSQTAGMGDEQEQQEVPVATQTTDHQWGRRERIW